MTERLGSSEQFKLPEPINEASAINRYLHVLNDIYDRDAAYKLSMAHNVQMVFGKNEAKPYSTAWRIILNPGMRLAERGLIADFDDTLVNATDRKRPFYEESSQLVPEEYREAFKKASQALNNTARVLPLNAAHPKRYTPLLELRGMSKLVHDLNGADAHLVAIPTTDEAATVYLHNFMETLGDDAHEATLPISRIALAKQGEAKSYFIEDDNRATALRFGDTTPAHVHPEVWNAFNTYMIGANIPEDEFKNFDLVDDVRFTIATFGELTLQLPKVVRALEEIKAKDRRLPDEILIITRGRKKPILEKFIDDTPWMRSVYIDDSVNQLGEMEDSPQLKRVHALRIGAKRAEDPVPDGVPSILIARTSHTSLIDTFLPAA